MAAPVRQIKEALLSQIASTAGVSSRIYDSLTYSPSNITYPYISVDIDNDVELEEYRVLGKFHRQCSATVSIFSKKTLYEDALDEIGDIVESVNELILADVTLGISTKFIAYESATYRNESDGNAAIVVCELVYNIDYRVASTDFGAIVA